MLTVHEAVGAAVSVCAQVRLCSNTSPTHL